MEPSSCGGTGTDYTVQTNTVQVQITTGTVTDSGSEYTVREGIFEGFFEVFWIFLKTEHDKPIGTPYRGL